MRLTTAEIDRYGPLYDCRPPCQDGISVISGPNEAGKTLYLEALLQLLEPDVADVMDPKPRVGQTPTGRVVVEHNGEQYECDGKTSLCEITQIEPAHLQSVFVVQDNDLQLPSDQEYYTSLIEKLGDIHTTEINAIQSALKDRGRLTNRRLNISSDQSYHNAGDVHDEAETLAEEIRDYTEEIEEEGLDELDARRLRIKRDLRETRKQLDEQQRAKTVAEFERLSEQLDTYRSTSDQLAELEEYDRDTLEELRTLSKDLQRDKEDLQELDDNVEKKQDEVNETAKELDDLTDQQSDLERRESAVDEARTALETYRERQGEATGAERQVELTRPAALVSLLGAGGAGVIGAITGTLLAIGLGVLLLLVSAISGGLYYRANKRLTGVETARESAVQTARDAGFEVETVDEVAPAIEAFEGELSRIRERTAKKEQEHQNAQETLERLQEEKSELETQIEEQEKELAERFEEADVESIDEFEEQVTAREELEPDQQSAKQSLVDRFEEPDADEPADKAAAWERELDEFISDVETDEVDAETYDEETLQQLEAQVERLEEKRDELQVRLDEHDDTLDEFDRRARDLNTQPFIGRGLGLDTRSKEGLETLAEDLDSVVQQLEEDAELSRKALEIFGRIESQEEQKLSELFDPDGPASRTFEQLTGGRYTQVAYNPEAHDLVVERQDGREFGPEVLSQGTKDQLYFATRVSLAQQLLGSTPGFLLLDDPFLAADPDRLDQGFQTLQELANNGWQILYLTAKQEVSETMVEEYDLNHTKMNPPIAE
ncbi:ATP-binding protein [Halobellus ordinarius]|uniref:ATP-binding protein n=1 Tax=Halobellus ordinarius TaxID=3075120 RepID=UPI00288054AF|nr:AAA family ATPase [Halobellus sp. ZY16]